MRIKGRYFANEKRGSVMIFQMADAVYAVDDFPDDDLLWRIEWIGGVGYNRSVPSDPTNRRLPSTAARSAKEAALSARSRSSQTKRTVRIGVGPAALYLNCLVYGSSVGR